MNRSMLTASAVLATAAAVGTGLAATSAAETTTEATGPRPATTASAPVAVPERQDGQAGVVAAQLAEVRAATARYHRVEAAVADGYQASPQCAASPAGVMGHHYVNPSRFGSTDPEEPAILLYVPGRDGLRLAGVEYFQADADQDLSTDGDRPTLFGVPFDGPMAGHEPGMPVHYDLHAWVWAHNPAGTFAAWNPALSC